MTRNLPTNADGHPLTITQRIRAIRDAAIAHSAYTPAPTRMGGRPGPSFQEIYGCTLTEMILACEPDPDRCITTNQGMALWQDAYRRRQEWAVQAWNAWNSPQRIVP